MEWLLKIGGIYFSFSIFTLATAWFASITVKPLCPRWWQRHICARDPYELPPALFGPESQDEARLYDVSHRQLLPRP
jgi:hypothetical protein